MQAFPRSSRTFGLVLALLLPAAALPARAAVPVASLSTVLTEIAQRVGGDQVSVTGIVKPGVDPHSFEPSPEDVKAVASARLVLASGLGMEGYLGKLRGGAAGSRFLAVGDTLPALRLRDEATGASIPDPHWWHSIANMKTATGAVAGALAGLDPAHAALFRANARAYEAELNGLDRWARLKIAELPRAARKLVTSHDAFGYFARDYGFAIYPIEGVSPEVQPSSRQVAELIEAIRAQHVKAVFFENMQNPKVIAEIVREAHAKIGGELYADGLGAGDGTTYAGMFRHNVTTIVEELK